jgi:hypothetical protein
MTLNHNFGYFSGVGSEIAKNKVLNVNLFDEIILIQRVEDVVHAIGYRGLKPTILIFEV